MIKRNDLFLFFFIILLNKSFALRHTSIYPSSIPIHNYCGYFNKDASQSSYYFAISYNNKIIIIENGSNNEPIIVKDIELGDSNNKIIDCDVYINSFAVGYVSENEGIGVVQFSVLNDFDTTSVTFQRSTTLQQFITSSSVYFSSSIHYIFSTTSNDPGNIYVSSSASTFPYVLIGTTTEPKLNEGTTISCQFSQFHYISYISTSLDLLIIESAIDYTWLNLFSHPDLSSTCETSSSSDPPKCKITSIIWPNREQVRPQGSGYHQSSRLLWVSVTEEQKIIGSTSVGSWILIIDILNRSIVDVLSIGSQGFGYVVSLSDIIEPQTNTQLISALSLTPLSSTTLASILSIRPIISASDSTYISSSINATLSISPTITSSESYESLSDSSQLMTGISSGLIYLSSSNSFYSFNTSLSGSSPLIRPLPNSDDCDGKSEADCDKEVQNDSSNVSAAAGPVLALAAVTILVGGFVIYRKRQAEAEMQKEAQAALEAQKQQRAEGPHALSQGNEPIRPPTEISLPQLSIRTSAGGLAPNNEGGQYNIDPILSARTISSFGSVDIEGNLPPPPPPNVPSSPNTTRTDMTSLSMSQNPSMTSITPQRDISRRHGHVRDLSRVSTTTVASYYLPPLPRHSKTPTVLSLSPPPSEDDTNSVTSLSSPFASPPGHGPPAAPPPPLDGSSPISASSTSTSATGTSPIPSDVRPPLPSIPTPPPPPPLPHTLTTLPSPNALFVTRSDTADKPITPNPQPLTSSPSLALESVSSLSGISVGMQSYSSHQQQLPALPSSDDINRSVHRLHSSSKSKLPVFPRKKSSANTMRTAVFSTPSPSQLEKNDISQSGLDFTPPPKPFTISLTPPDSGSESSTPEKIGRTREERFTEKLEKELGPLNPKWGLFPIQKASPADIRKSITKRHTPNKIITQKVENLKHNDSNTTESDQDLTNDDLTENEIENEKESEKDDENESHSESGIDSQIEALQDDDDSSES